VSVKLIQWLGSSRRDIQAFPNDARQVAGFQLYRVQRGLDSNDWKPMPNVGSGVKEIRVHTDLEHRVLYTANLADAIYVSACFREENEEDPEARSRHRSRAVSRLAQQPTENKCR
jgi:phage-related protein